MPDTEAQLLQLRSRITAAQRARVRAEHERDAAQAAADQARDRLREHFNVTTVEDARTLHARLTDELTTAIDDLKRQLDAAGV